LATGKRAHTRETPHRSGKTIVESHIHRTIVEDGYTSQKNYKGMAACIDALNRWFLLQGRGRGLESCQTFARWDKYLGLLNLYKLGFPHVVADVDEGGNLLTSAPSMKAD
jgi:hypothetical protein